MANLRVFVSSTCYDLSILRSQLRQYLQRLSYEPVMSDFSDVLFDPRQHTHTSCVQEVADADVLILIIGSRFGGRAIPKALESVDLERFKGSELSAAPIQDKSVLSITQLEVLKAIESGVPIFTFVEAGVLNDHLVYEKNKLKKILAEIEFPHIEKQDTAKYIFEFINFLRLRTENNGVISFTRLEDIEDHLSRQWSALFQRLLYEHRVRHTEVVRLDFVTSQLADIKAALVSSISSESLRDTARAVLRFRTLIEFLLSLQRYDAMLADLATTKRSWREIVSAFQFDDLEPTGERYGAVTMVVRQDGQALRARLPPGVLVDRFPREWDDFRLLGDNQRTAIVAAVKDSSHESRRLVYPIRPAASESLGSSGDAAVLSNAESLATSAASTEASPPSPEAVKQ